MRNLSTLIIVILVVSCGKPKVSYLGQKTPGTSPELFAPSIVNTDSIELNAVFNNSMTEVFFTRIINGSYVIYHSELIDDQWTVANAIPMFPENTENTTAVDMSLTPDGNTMYFLGVLHENETLDAPSDIFRSQKVNGKWQMAERVGYPISTDEYSEAYPVIVADGSLYFVSDRPGGFGKQDVYRAQYLGDGKFDTPKSISPVVNTSLGSGDTYVAPDESYLISNKRFPKNSGLYVSFKKDGEWQPLIYLKEPINSEWTDFCPYMTPDNKYFFFSRRYSDPPESGWAGVIKGEVYWVDANVIFNMNDK
ncbi:hypothetical protein [Lutimonas vermicola]|uniref:WD40 repeat protein n=1 Tax=Lutimonas vermicola TaxID=414288 RepID=A0ABU9L240_9FLAO